MVSQTPLVAILMGSKSDWEIMQPAQDVLKELGIESEMKVLSAHRSPDLVSEYAKTAAKRGLKVLIAGAGGAAHLPGVVAALTRLPVIGVPIKASHLDGMDSLLSIVQMPRGVPVATVGINNAKNAGLLAARILALTDRDVDQHLEKWIGKMQEDFRK